MAIIKKDYEISLWKERLGERGQKIEFKEHIIGSHDMDYLGRATNIKLTRKLTGINTLTFQLVSKFFDSKIGDYVDNEFCSYVFNEKKVKLKYDGQWFEFYVKNIDENQTHKNLVYTYTCEDAFIDELSRNGYGITFDTELYNNVEEMGVFSEQILKDSIWTYNSKYNWGDFTEYAEEKMFKIPVSIFSKLEGYKLNYIIENEEIENIYTKETRKLELGDDRARELKYFWDNKNFDKGIDLLSKPIDKIDNDGYIYIPYSCLDFCYYKENSDDKAATEIPLVLNIEGVRSYALSPPSLDPTYLIQFIALPMAAELQIDESGLLVNKDYTYVMTLEQWNKNVKSLFYYDLENKSYRDVDNYGEPQQEKYRMNKIVTYNGYLEKIGHTDVTFAKKISISDRTEINISEEIDQYVTVYNNKDEEYSELFTEEQWIGGNGYRVCSYDATRTIIPQLARNLIQNGTEIADTSGWEKMIPDSNSSIEVICDDNKSTEGLRFKVPNTEETFSFINFGIVGQEEIIEKNQIYVLSLKGNFYQNKGNEINEIDGSKIISVSFGEGGFDSKGNYALTSETIMEVFLEDEEEYGWKKGTNYFIKFPKNITNPYFVITIKLKQEGYFDLKYAKFFKAFTKGVDFFKDGYYKYSGREIFLNTDETFIKVPYESMFLEETDIMEGDTYAYKKYFRQQLVYGDNLTKDTFMLKSYLNNDIEKNGLSPIEYTEDDYKIVTDYINLNKCKYYNEDNNANEKNFYDCSYGNVERICLYQKYGYCPYLFQTQKHCRKIRTLNGEKSNRFNLTQELSKVFEIYPVYYTYHNEIGKVLTQQAKDELGEYEKQKKEIFYITEKGSENKLGFRYEKNLQSISRTLDSKEIVTKLYVEDVDSELSKTGLCSIKTAEDNPSKDSYIIDFSYYTTMGILDKIETENDLYGKDDQDLGFLKTLGYYNTMYDNLSNKIINLQDQSYTELEANVQVNITGIETALQELNRIKSTLSRYNHDSTAYENYEQKKKEQEKILFGLVEDTFSTNGDFDNEIKNANDFLENINEQYSSFQNFNKTVLSKFLYKNYGMFGQYVAEREQINTWKKERSKYLKKINDLSLKYYQKYEPFLKEGTWSDSNYLSDNAYYFGAKEVAKQGAIPKVTYNVSVADIAALDEDYTFNIADTTYVEDVEMFGTNKYTGLPNRLKVIISGITYDLDIPSQNSIEIQNYTTQFEDLFQQVTASVQSLSFNENIYKRSSNFTSTQNISKESLQGGLSNNQLTLLETKEKNIEIDHNGQKGSDINNHNNKYKLSGEGLFFSNNGGQSWNVGVTPKGINADYIKVGTLDASKVQIMDGNYIYFLWDKTGISAYKEPSSSLEEPKNSFAKFNKYGLSLVEEGQIRLRAGYSFNGEEGKIETETNQNGDIGFYLYDQTGNVILKTEANDSGNTARLSLAGEIFAADQISIAANYKYTNRFSNYYLNKKTNVYKETNETVEVDDISNITSVSIYLVKDNKWEDDITAYKDEHENIYIKTSDDIYTKCSIMENTYLETDLPVSINSKETSDIIETIPVTVLLQNKYIGVGDVYSFQEQEGYIFYIIRSGTSAQKTNIAVYINNQDNSQNDETSQESRLISCVQKKGEETANIFSILGDGSLYIGGTVSPSETDLENLPSTIRINNSEISLKSGKLYLNDTDILEYINQQIAIVNGNIGYNESSISSIDTRLTNLENIFGAHKHNFEYSESGDIVSTTGPIY